VKKNNTLKHEGGSKEIKAISNEITSTSVTSVSDKKRRCWLCETNEENVVRKTWLVSNLFSIPLYLLMILLLVILAPKPDTSDVPDWCYANFRAFRTGEAGIF
jgi:hypothetical protein